MNLTRIFPVVACRRDWIGEALYSFAHLRRSFGRDQCIRHIALGRQQGVSDVQI